ncbi:MAG: tetratricopeptide repeat protein [Nitrospinae bacterium]|nr:tetratricopeptide repeat protein [Nitrospinota bacterium]
MRKTIFARIVVIIAFAAAVLAAPPRESLAYEVNKSAVVLLAVKDASGKVFSTGTGFIVSPEGTLVTNYHVLVDAVSIDAVLEDGSTAPVKGVLHTDRAKDFAIIKLAGGPFSTLELGDSDRAREFDYVSALGYLTEETQMEPGGAQGSVLQTYGFILGVHPQAYPDFSYIYSTAEFGPGFSGGPVVDRQNKVVGLATVEGRSINLALPINYVKPFIKESKIIPLGKIVEEDKDSKEVLYYKGNFALYALGEPDTAMNYFNRILEKDPGFVLAHYDLAVAYREKGMFEETVKEYEKTVQMNPRFPEALSNLGGHYFMSGKMAEAAAAFKKAVQLYPNFLQALSNLGAALNKLGKQDEAIPYLEKALSLDPEFGMAHYNMGNARFAANQFTDARKAYNKAVDLGVDLLSLHWNLYEMNVKEGRDKDAEKELEIILKIDPENQEALRKLRKKSPVP